MGIGTTAPVSKLVVSGGGAVVGQNSTTGYMGVEENGNDLIKFSSPENYFKVK